MPPEMAANPRFADGTECPDQRAFEEEFGPVDPSTWSRSDRLDCLRRCAEAWRTHFGRLTSSFETGGIKASDRRLLDKAGDNAEWFATQYGRARDNVLYRIAQSQNGPGGLTSDVEGGGPEMASWRSYLRTGSESEVRAQGVAAGSAGGFVVPQAFRNRIVETMKAFGGVRSVAEVITTDNGADMPFPTANDTANVGAILAENTQVTEQDATFNTKTLRAYVYTSKLIRVSFQLLQDSAFPIDQWLARKLAERVARAQNQHFTTGTGTAQPEGVHTNAVVGVTGATGSTTTAGYDDLVDLVHSVDPAYREAGEAVFMMSDATLAKVRKVKDANGHPLLEPDVQRGMPNTVLGHRVVINNDMPGMAANAKSILFGNFSAYYVIRDSAQFEVLALRERFADFLQHGFIGWQRTDALVQDNSAVRAYANSAT